MQLNIQNVENTIKNHTTCKDPGKYYFSRENIISIQKFLDYPEAGIGRQNLNTLTITTCFDSKENNIK
jgi:hypothetical protein